MILNFDQITSAVSGVSYTEESSGKTVFHRFSKELESAYHREAPEFDKKLLATAGVKLRFRTDSSKLKLGVETDIGSTRKYFSHDILVNGIHKFSLRNFGNEDLKGYEPTKEFPLGYYEKEFDLGSGEKEVTILFPALVSSGIRVMEIDDDSLFFPLKNKGTYLALGDSISQGYDCSFPVKRYTNRVAEKFGLDEHNLCIGGDIFRPGTGKHITEDNISLITVAYGSNDWKRMERETARRNCEEYLGYIAAKFPGIPVFVISPIWREDYGLITDYGKFTDVHDFLGTICSKYPDFTLIDGFDFVPHKKELFGDGVLHPNDSGFAFYAGSLIESIKKSSNKYAP